MDDPHTLQAKRTLEPIRRDTEEPLMLHRRVCMRGVEQRLGGGPGALARVGFADLGVKPEVAGGDRRAHQDQQPGDGEREDQPRRGIGDGAATRDAESSHARDGSLSPPERLLSLRPRAGPGTEATFRDGNFAWRSSCYQIFSLPEGA